MKVLPPELVQPILEILSYCGAALLGWVAKLLQSKNKNKKSEQ